jgi:predicted metalloprotease with PDZ domain
MLLRSGLKSFDDYLKTLQRKVLINTKYFNPDISLVDLAMTSYTPEGHKQYGNIYMKGALVAGLLDIKLLELSEGERGLKDVINEFATKYGPNKSFEDATFFDEFTKATYPEIRTFFDDYVINSKTLPLKTYYEKLGIVFDEENGVFSTIENASEAQLNFRKKWMAPIK